MKRLFPLTILIITAFNLFSQKVENVDFNFLDEKIIIFYDLVDCNSKYSYEIDIIFVDESGGVITPRILSGDFGRVICGKNKQVEWQPYRELSSFEGDYKVVVSIVNIYNRFGGIVDTKFNPGKNSLVLSNIIIAPGLKYHYSKVYGFYVCYNWLFEEQQTVIFGLSRLVGTKSNFYFGLGYANFGGGISDWITIEGGVLIKSKRIVYDIGIVHIGELDIPVLPRLGIGFHF